MLTPREIVYTNGGEIYKSTSERGFADNYELVPGGDPAFQFVKRDGKQYLFTTEFKQHFGGGEGVSLDGFDLCPAVTRWICLGANTPEERNNFDLFFAIDSVQQLHDVAAYYNLPYPITAELGEQITAHPEHFNFWRTPDGPIVPAGVKFIDGKPAIFKVYTYPHPFGMWRVWMFGRSYYNQGALWEDGASYIAYTGGDDWGNTNMRHQHCLKQAEILYTERADGVKTRYMYDYKQDPLLMWRGEELDAAGQVVSIKTYESTAWIRTQLFRMTRGPDLKEHDLCPDVSVWLGRAKCALHDEVELLFAMTGGTEQLGKVAAYYGLPVPYDQVQAAVLDTTPELYRARHYDIYKQGPGSWFPIVVCSVVFVGGVASKFLLYTFLRQWETDEDLQAPDPSFPASLITYGVVPKL